jgi:hypothetical protein
METNIQATPIKRTKMRQHEKKSSSGLEFNSQRKLEDTPYSTNKRFTKGPEKMPDVLHPRKQLQYL